LGPTTITRTKRRPSCREKRGEIAVTATVRQRRVIVYAKALYETGEGERGVIASSGLLEKGEKFSWRISSREGTVEKKGCTVPAVNSGYIIPPETT